MSHTQCTWLVRIPLPLPHSTPSLSRSISPAIRNMAFQFGRLATELRVQSSVALPESGSPDDTPGARAQRHHAFVKRTP